MTKLAKVDIIVTKNGREVAVLKTFTEDMKNEYGLNEEATAYEISKNKMSYDEFMKLSKDSDERMEIIDGELFILGSPKTKHQRALSELHILFYNFFKEKNCIPMIAPYDIRLKRDDKEKNDKKDISVVQPDIMVICDMEEFLGDDDDDDYYYHGTPALVVEILSKSTRRKDIIKKS